MEFAIWKFWISESCLIYSKEYLRKFSEFIVLSTKNCWICFEILQISKLKKNSLRWNNFIKNLFLKMHAKKDRTWREFFSFSTSKREKVTRFDTYNCIGYSECNSGMIWRNFRMVAQVARGIASAQPHWNRHESVNIELFNNLKNTNKNANLRIRAKNLL